MKSKSECGSLCHATEAIDLPYTPVQVAARLQHLEELVFFDTAGNLPSRCPSPVSIIAARPEQIIRGGLSDLKELRQAIDRYSAHAPSTGFPAGGACGWIDYDGSFCFGIFPEMLIYQHDRRQWWQCGDLISEIQDQEFPSPAPKIGNFQASMSKQTYQEGVHKIHDYIAAGDIYQVNLTQRFSAHTEGKSLFPLYQHLRKTSPAPLATWIKLCGREILSSSPESFLRISGKAMETRPIKGTRPRGSTEEKDCAMATELLESEKENAELVMITDLERNDLGRVSEFGTVRVAEMLALEKLEQVYHLVSTVTGTLREELDHLDAIAACFPGGSITGAPKKRAMEIIDELEPVPRGLYTGAVGYLGFNGESQLNISIRTLVGENQQLHYHVGAGIVADSDPADEYQETLDKAKGIRLAIEQMQRQTQH